MRTLLTGATGLIGANLVRTLLRAGERPRVLLTPGSDARSLAGLDVERVSGDVRDAHSLAKAMAGIARVFHAAGHVRFDDAGPFIVDDHQRGRNPAGPAGRAQRRGAQAGARVVQRRHRARDPGPARRPRKALPPERSTPYAESKRAAEELALGDWGGLEVVVCNPTFVVGAYGTGATSAEVVRLVASGVVKAYPPGGANFVNADDVADGLVLAMRAGRPRTRYILGGENLTHREFLSQIAEECGQRAPGVPLPGGPRGGWGAPATCWGRSPRRGWAG